MPWRLLPFRFAGAGFMGVLVGAAGTYSMMSPGWQLRAQHILSMTVRDTALCADIFEHVQEFI